MNTSLKALKSDAEMLSMLFSSSDQNLKGQNEQFAELFQTQLASKFDGVGSLVTAEPQALLDVIQQFSLQNGSTFNLTEDQVLKLNQLLLATSVSEAKAVESQQADLQQNSVSSNEKDAALSLGLDLSNNGDTTVVDESQAEEDLMDTTAVTASPKNQTVNVFVPDTSTKTDGSSFNQVLQQTANRPDNTNQKNDSASDAAETVPVSSSASRDKTNTQSSSETDKTDTDKEQNTAAASENATDPVDHAIMLAQLMRSTELPADQLALKKTSLQEASTAQISALPAKETAEVATDKLSVMDQLKASDRTVNFSNGDDNLAQDKTEADAFADSKKKGISLANLDLKDAKDTKDIDLTKLDISAKQSSTDNATATKTDTDKAISSAKNDAQNNGSQGNPNGQQFGSNHQDTNQLSQASQTSNSAAIDAAKPVQNQFSTLLNVNNSNLTQTAASANSALYSQGIDTPVGYPNWDQALNQRVGMMLSNGNQSATLSLNPPELGPLQITVHMHNQGVADATFVTAHAEVRQAIEAAIPKLREMLDQSGIQLGQTNINSQTNQGNSQQGQYSSGAQSFKYGAHDEDDGSSEQIVPVMSRTISRGQSAVDTFA